MNRLSACVAIGLALAASPRVAADTEQYRGWIAEMKESARGPFSRIRWFCQDGSVLPPRTYACAERGGGHQHGEWSERTKALRGEGYRIANLLAGIDAAAALGADAFADELAQLLIEKYLIAADDGWIFRRARFYRGAIQEEDERAGGCVFQIDVRQDELELGLGAPSHVAEVMLGFLEHLPGPTLPESGSPGHKKQHHKNQP